MRYLFFQRDGELLDGRLLFLVQFLGDRDVDRDQEVAGGVLTMSGHAATAHAHRRRRLRAGGHLQRHQFIERRHFDGGAQHRGREWHVDTRRHVATTTLESGVRRDVHVDEEVTGWPSLGAGIALALDLDALSVVHTGWDAHIHFARGRLASGAVAGRTGRDDSPAATLTDRTDAGHGERSLVVVEHSSTAAAFAGDEARPRRGATPLAGVARLVARQVHRRRHADDCAAKAQMERRFEIGAALGARATSATEEPSEDVAEIAEVARLEVESTSTLTTGSAEAGRGRSETTNLVVLLAFRFVTEHVVGDRDLFELLLGSGIGIGVRRLREFAIGARDLFLSRARAKA